MDGTSAKDWWRASLADLKAMKACYDQQLYGISAYHCQQALEKAVKTAFIYHNLPVDAKRLGHNVLYKMFDTLIPKIPTSDEHKLYNSQVVRLLESAGKNIQIDTNRNIDNNNRSSTKDFFWGQSLGIDVHNDDLENFLKKMQSPMVSAVNEHLPRLLNNFPRLKNIPPDNFDEFIEFAHDYTGQKLNVNRPELRIWYWTLPNIPTMLKITPHEEYGRYPGRTYGKQREEWYKTQCKHLYNLESDVKRAIVRLYKNVLTRR